MFYVERDAAGVVRGIQKWPAEGGSSERLSDDDPEVLAFKNRQNSRVAIDHILPAPQFALVLTMLKIEPDAFEAEISALPDLTDLQKTYHQARFWRGARYRRDDPILVTVLTELGVTDESLDAAWLTAKDMAESEDF